MSKYVREAFYKNSLGRYEGLRSKCYVTCGEAVTLYENRKSYKGRIEHNGQDYYFYNPTGDHKELYEGVHMKIE